MVIGMIGVTFELYIFVFAMFSDPALEYSTISMDEITLLHEQFKA
jgi:hypothetical protein